MAKSKTYELPMTGGCRCGQVRFAVTQDPLVSIACHCTDCQQLSASAFSFGLGVPEDGFEITKGDVAEFSKKADSGNTSRQFFCTNCSTWIYTAIDEQEGAVIVRPTQLDDHSWFRPLGQMFTRSALPYALLSTPLSWDTEFETTDHLQDVFRATFRRER